MPERQWSLLLLLANVNSGMDIRALLASCGDLLVDWHGIDWFTDWSMVDGSIEVDRLN
jgi:hypothetical protein